MAVRYKLAADIDNGDGTKIAMNSVRRILDNGQVTSIPFANGNASYEEYKEWLAAGNTPEAAD